MKILHTSDWHLGRSLYGRKRYDEFSAFLDWLVNLLKSEQVEVLLIAGDVFDTSTPSNRAQQLYYGFLCKVAASCCRHIVVIAGNHDSAAFLNAPKELLLALNVYVVGAITENLEDEVISLLDSTNTVEAIICAVPYLRDRDIRSVEAGESIGDKNSKLIAGVKNHYAEVCQLAISRQKAKDIPIIAMGHLFAAGGKTVEGDGVRELYVGSLAHVSHDIFPDCIDYLALGHLHVPQQVGGVEHFRYSGSPIPMGYGEVGQQKKVLLVQFKKRIPQINEYPIPCFQALEKIAGTMDDITEKIAQLKSAKSHAWLEIEYTGKEIIKDLLNQTCHEAIAETNMEIRRIKNKRTAFQFMSQAGEDETLDDLDVNDVFNRCLDSYEVLMDERPELIQSYREIILSLYENKDDEL